MAQVKYFDKKTGTTYIYESQSYYDAEKHQSRSKRRLIGKIDPETGEMVPTGKRGRPPKANIGTKQEDVDYKQLYDRESCRLSAAESQISDLRQEITNLKKQLEAYRQLVRKMAVLCTTIQEE